MSLKKFLITLGTMKSGNRVDRAAVSFLTGTCKVAGFLLNCSARVARNNKAQVLLEYFILLCVITLFAMVMTSTSFYGRFRSNMNESFRLAVETMDQPGVAGGTGGPGSNVLVPWWDEPEPEPELPWWIVNW